jgi:hypothetical protein
MVSISPGRVVASLVLQMLHEFGGGVQVLLQHPTFSEACILMLASLKGVKRSLSSAGMFKSVSTRVWEASWMEGGLINQKRPRIEVIMSVEEELSPEFDACQLQLLLQVRGASSDIILSV